MRSERFHWHGAHKMGTPQRHVRNAGHGLNENKDEMAEDTQMGGLHAPLACFPACVFVFVFFVEHACLHWGRLGSLLQIRLPITHGRTHCQ